MNFNAYFSNDLSRLLNQFDIATDNFIVKPNFTQVCAGTTDENSLEQLFRTLVELPVKPEIQLVEISNVNAPPLRQVIKDLNLVGTLKKYGVRVVYLDEQTRSEYGQYLSFSIPNLLLERREERLIVIAPPKEHKFLPGGIPTSRLTTHLDGYSGVMKSLAVGIVHKDDMRKTHGVSGAITEKYETENLRILWTMMSEEEKIIVKEEHNRIINQVIERIIKPGDIFILTNRGMLGDHINGTTVTTDRWIVGDDPKKVDELGVKLLLKLKRGSAL